MYIHHSYNSLLPLFQYQKSKKLVMMLDWVSKYVYDNFTTQKLRGYLNHNVQNMIFTTTGIFKTNTNIKILSILQNPIWCSKDKWYENMLHFSQAIKIH